MQLLRNPADIGRDPVCFPQYTLETLPERLVQTGCIRLQAVYFDGKQRHSLVDIVMQLSGNPPALLFSGAYEIVAEVLQGGIGNPPLMHLSQQPQNKKQMRQENSRNCQRQYAASILLPKRWRTVKHDCRNWEITRFSVLQFVPGSQGNR